MPPQPHAAAALPHANSGRPRPLGTVARRLEGVEDLRGKPQVRRRASRLAHVDVLAATETGTLRAHELVVETDERNAADEVARHSAEEGRRVHY